MKSVGHRWGPLLDMETDDPEIGGEDSEDAREKHQGGPQDILHSEQEIQTGDNTNREGNRYKTDSTDSKAKKDENERKDRKETRYLSDSEYNEKKQKLFRYAKTDNEEGLLCELDVMQRDQKNELFRETDDRGNSALHYAAKAGNLNICKLVYNTGESESLYKRVKQLASRCESEDAGDKLVARGQNKMTPLQFAARYGDEGRETHVWECMKWIMEECEKKRSIWNGKEDNYNIHLTDKYGFSILHHAIQNTNWHWETQPSVVKELLMSKHKFRIGDMDRQGNTSLHIAAQFDTQEKHKIFDIFYELRNDETVSSKEFNACMKKNAQGQTPLHIACSVGNLESVRQLFSALKGTSNETTEATSLMKSIIDIKDIDGYNPITIAIENNNLELVNELIKEGADVSEHVIDFAAR